MPWPQNAVPKFGDWDKNEDLSYSIVFDKARADKEKVLLGLKDDESDALRNQYMLGTTDIPSGKRASYPPHDRKHELVGRRASEDSSLQSLSKPVRMRQSIPTVAPKEMESYHSYESSHGPYQERVMKLGAPPGPRRTTPGGFVGTKGTRSHRSSESSSTVASERAGLPKFGDWDASDVSSGEGFTVIFNKASNERKLKAAEKSSSRPVSHPPRRDEDLYTPSQQAPIRGHKKGGLMNFLCCASSHSHG